MAEVLVWPEGTAVFWTANGNQHTAIYARDLRVSPQRMTYRYRVPFAPAYTHVSLQNTPATYTVALAESPHTQTLKAWLLGAPPGTLHAHLFAITPGVNNSGGIFLYSGTLDNGELAGNAGNDEQSFTLNGWAETWTAY